MKNKNNKEQEIIYFCKYGHLISREPVVNNLLHTTRICKCGELACFSILSNEIIEKIGSIWNLQKLKIQVQTIRKYKHCIKLVIYDIGALGFTRVEPNPKNVSLYTSKQRKLNAIREARKMDIPSDSSIFFCEKGHLINGHVKEDELFSPEEQTLVCECGSKSIFCISKKTLSYLLGGIYNLQKIQIAEQGVKIGSRYIQLPVYNLTILGCEKGLFAKHYK